MATNRLRQLCLLITEGPRRAWELSGLIDFEPAMCGERDYEFVAVGVRWLTAGSPPSDRTVQPPVPAASDRTGAMSQIGPRRTVARTRARVHTRDVTGATRAPDPRS